MKNYILAGLMCVFAGCASQSSGSGGETVSTVGTTVTSSGGSGGVGGSGTGGETNGCPDPTKSWDELSNYYGPILPLPGEAPDAAAEYVWGPWSTDVKVVSYTVGWTAVSFPLTIRTAIWLENDLVPTKNPNDAAVVTSTNDNLFAADGIIAIRATPATPDFIVPKGNTVVTAGMYDDNGDSYGTYHDPTCSVDRNYYWRPIGCSLPDGTDPGPHHATLINPLCSKSFDANWAFSIEVVPQ